MSHRQGIHRLNTDSSVVLASGERFVRFALAGTGGFIVQLATLAVLTSMFDVNYLVATLVAVEAAILSNFVWHQRWTLRIDRGSAGWIRA